MLAPDFASLHPGYEAIVGNTFARPVDEPALPLSSVP